MHETRRRSGRDPGRVWSDDLDTDTGRGRPGSPGLCRPRCAGGRVAHAPLLLPSSLQRAARPAKGASRQDTDIGASIGSYEASQSKRTVGRRSTVSHRRHHSDGRWGWWPAGHRSPSSAPLAVGLVTRTIATWGWRAATRHTPSRRLQRRSRYDPRETGRPHGAH